MKKIILDTDIGSDIDDAVCLAYLLARDDCEILGITTVTGQPALRAEMARQLCRTAGKDVPIYPGIEYPLLTEIRQPRVPQAAGIDVPADSLTVENGVAVDFLRRTIRSNPGEVTLLAIGAMTNIALLFKTDPEIPALLDSLVLMCGVFTNDLSGVGPLEWNAIGDPYATAMVYQTPVEIHRSIGLDVTCRVQMPAESVKRRFNASLLKPVLDWADIWFQDRPVITFHDPLAAAVIFDEELCTFERGAVEVELESRRLRGMTHWKQDRTGPHEVALKVDSERFFDHFFSVF